MDENGRETTGGRERRPEGLFPIRVILPYVASLIAVGFVLVVVLGELGRIRAGAEAAVRASIQESTVCLAQLAADGYTDIFEEVDSGGGRRTLAPNETVLRLLSLDEARIYLRDNSSTTDSSPSAESLGGDSLAASLIGGSGLVYERVQTPSGWVFRTGAAWPSPGPDWQALAVVTRRMPPALGFLEGLRSGGLVGLFAIAVLVTFPAFVLLRLSSMRRRRELETFEEETSEPPSGPGAAQGTVRPRGSGLPEVIGSLDGPLAAVLLDADGTIVSVSRAAAEMFDERTEDLTGEPFASTSCFGPETRRLLSGDLRKALDSSPVVRIARTDGSVAHTRLRSASAIGSGEDGYLLVFAQDVSEMEAMKSERERLMEREMALNSYAVLATMVRGFSHDLNNLLAGIIGAASLGDAISDETGPDHQRYSAILTAAERAAAISDELIHTASLTEAQSRPLDPSAELQEIAEALRSVLPRTISLEVAVSGGELPMLIADRALLRQVLYNLALRSSGALQGTGRIRFYLEDIPDPLTDPRFTTACRSRGNVRCVCISVSDGTVLPPGLQKMLTASDADAYEIEKGYGAGMAAVSQAVKALKGCLTCSQEARGTVVRMLFPAAERPKPPESIRSPGVSGVGISVLIAEEEVIVRETTRQILEHFGFRTAESTSGDEALAILEHERFDALLLDLGSSGTPSLEVVRISRERWPSMAVLLTSSYEAPAGLDGPSLRHGTGFLRKPYFPEAVAAEIVRLLGTLGR